MFVCVSCNFVFRAEIAIESGKNVHDLEALLMISLETTKVWQNKAFCIMKTNSGTSHVLSSANGNEVDVYSVVV